MTEKANQYRPENHEHHCFGDIIDKEAWEETAIIDGKDDCDWFEQNPGNMERHRKATDREVRALGCPKTTEVVVKRVSHDSYMRLYY